MSTSQPLTLPLAPEDVVEALSHNHDTVRNINQGAGSQQNATQAGGHGNSQYNASQQHFHNHEPPRVQPKRPWRIPRQAAGQYAGYADVLQTLEGCLLQPQPEHEQVVCVLSGMGGVGKSELVLQFLKRHNSALRKRFWAVLWVDCSSEATARADFKSFGNLCGWAPDESDSLHGVKDQLASLDERSLLLLDNCDDTKTNFSHYIPNSVRVSVVLTTRLFDADKYASLDTQDVTPKLFVRMDGLDPASATRLILEASRTREKSEETIQHAKQIADALDYHPLAIIVASSLIKSDVYTIEKYAGALKDRLTQKELLEIETELAKYRKVSATFEISAIALQELSASDESDESAQHALDLLDLLALMHHQGVSDDMFVRAWEYEEEVLKNCMKQDRGPQELSMWHVAQARKYFPGASIGVRRCALLRARAHLIRLTLVKQNSEDDTTYMHSLVHLWARERLQYIAKPWAAAASILALSAQGSRGWKPYSPQLSLHCETNFRLTQTMGGIQLYGEAMCRIWCNFAWQMLQAHHPQTPDVVNYFLREVRSLSATEADAVFVTEPQHLLGLLFLRDGDISQAVAVLKEVTEIRARLAEDHPSRLVSQHQLASAYLQDGRTSQAIEIFEHVVYIEEKLAADHPDRLASQRALANAYLQDGRTSQAIKNFEHVVHIERKLAADHPDRLSSQHELASAYLQDGRTSQAIRIFEHVVHIREEKLAADQPGRLASQRALATAYLQDGRTSQAIEIFEHIIYIQKERLVADHPSRLVAQHELARAYLEDGRISQAIDIFEHVVQLEDKLSASHPDRLISQHELARAYWHATRFAEADELMSYVVDVQQHSLRKDHPDRILSEKVLAMIREDPRNPAAVSEDCTASADQEPGDAHDDDMPSNL